MVQFLKLVKGENMQFKNTDKIIGTSLQGYIKASYEQLVQTFGQQKHNGDGWKTTCEWALEWEDGTVATIYDWKQSTDYLGEDGIHYEDVTDWNVGGNNLNSVWYVQRELS